MFPIILLTTPIQKGDLEIYKANPYDSMIKYVVDINKSMIALGGEMHADAEKILLEYGSIQENLWGANIYPWGDIIEIEYTSLINIRPTFGNRSMEIQDDAIREKVKKITFELIQIL